MADIILTEEQRKLLKEYKKEAFGYLNEIQAANENLKDVVKNASEGSGLDKKIVSKFFKASFKNSVDDLVEEAEVLQFLSE